MIVPDEYVPLFHGWIQRRVLDGTPSTWPTTSTSRTAPASCSSGTRPTAPSTSARDGRESSTSASGRARDARGAVRRRDRGRLLDRRRHRGRPGRQRRPLRSRRDPPAGQRPAPGPQRRHRARGAEAGHRRRPRRGPPGAGRRDRRGRRRPEGPPHHPGATGLSCAGDPRAGARTGPRSPGDVYAEGCCGQGCCAGMAARLLEAAELGVGSQRGEIPVPRRAVRAEVRLPPGPVVGPGVAVVARSAHCRSPPWGSLTLGGLFRRGPPPAIGVFPSPVAAR